MELLITIISAYLAITLIYCSDSFIRSAICFTVLGCAYATSAILHNGYIFYLSAAIAAIVALPFFRITIIDLIKIAFVSLIAIFWLSTAEFVDGFAYSETFVAIGIALAANLLFPIATRQYLCAVTILISYGLTLNNFTAFTALSLALSLCIGWILTQNYYKKTSSVNNIIKKVV